MVFGVWEVEHRPKFDPKSSQERGLESLLEGPGASWEDFEDLEGKQSPSDPIGAYRRPVDLGPLGTQVGAMLAPKWLPIGVELRYQHQHAEELHLDPNLAPTWVSNRAQDEPQEALGTRYRGS